MVSLVFPSVIDRSSPVKLPHQIADAFRKRIAAGDWKTGERLPSSREIKRSLGVSLRVAVEALRILAAEGSVSLREKSRAVVNPETTVERNRRILLVMPGGVGYWDVAVMYESIWSRLNEAGYIPSVVSLFRSGTRGAFDLVQLKSALAGRFEAVVCAETASEIRAAIAASRNPFVCLLCAPGTRPMAGGGVIPLVEGPAYAAFARHCVRTNVRTALVVRKWKGDGDEISAVLRNAGVAVEEWTVRAPLCRFRGEAIERAAHAAFFSRLGAKDGRKLPDMVYFTDDYACYGALTAMLERGVCIPEDVRVATVCNKGSLRTFGFGFDRIEYDPTAMGDMSAAAILKFLRTGAFPSGVVLSPVFRHGARRCEILL